MNPRRETLRTLRLDDLSVSFGGVQAVRHVTAEISAGEIFGLIGPNGAGKTSLLNLVSRLIRPDSGHIHWNGAELPRQPRRMADVGLARTFQTPKILDDCSVIENVMLGGHRTIGAGMLRAAVGTPRARSEERRLRERAEETLARCGFEGRGTAPGRTLPFADRRKVELARCLITEPELVLLDEPTSGMDRVEVEHFLRTIRDLNRAGTTFVLVEHNVPLVAEMCSTIGVMVMGELIASGASGEIVSDPRVVAAYLGSGAPAPGGDVQIAADRGPGSRDPATRSTPLGHPRLDTALLSDVGRSVPGSSTQPTDLVVRDLCAGYGQLEVLRGISITARAGQVVLVMGRNGVGKSTLFNALAGFVRCRRGTVSWRGVRIEQRTARSRMKHGIGLVPQGGGVVRGQSVRENLQLSLLGTGAGRAEVKSRIEEVFELFPSLADRQAEHGGNLSGGERQMLAIAKVLVKRPSLLLLDEPSFGLAPRVLEELAKLIEKLRAAGMAVCIAEQNIRWCGELVAYGLHLENGRVASVVTRDELRDDAQVALLYLGNKVGSV